MSLPRFNLLRNDPARFKGRYMAGAPAAAAGYLDRIRAYNTSLYEPADTKRAAVMPTFLPLSTARQIQNPAGDQIPGRSDLERIASTYGGSLPAPYPYPGSGVRDNPYRTVSANPNIQPRQNPSGVAGPTGLPESEGYVPGMPSGWQPLAPTPSAIDTAPRATMPSDAPRQNAQQRWMGSEPMTAESKVAGEREAWRAEGGSQRSWNKAGVAAGIRPRIDARARQASGNSDASASIREKWGFTPDSMKLPY